MKQTKKLRGSSLVVTVVIALVLAILCSSLILLAYYNRQNEQTSDIEFRLNNNIESAINLVLADSIIYVSLQTDRLDLFQEGNDSVVISRRLWGLFQVGDINAFYGRFSRKKTFFYGSALPDSLNGCLYLADHQRSLSLVRETKLVGDAYLSKAGLKAGYIDQQGFSFDKLIEGEIKISNKALPGLSEEVTGNIKNLLGICHDTAQTKGMQLYIDQDSIFRSFADVPLLIFKSGKTILENCNLNGQVIIFSDSILEISSTAMLKDVILVAPSIRIKEGFRGTVQAIANDSLIVENNCFLDYPSSLILQKRETETLQNRLIIGEGCKISGIVISLCDNDDLYKSYIGMGAKTIINGVVYAMGYLNLGANVTGTVLTDFFIHKTPSVIYENYLADIEINRKKLSGFFLASPLFKGQSKKGILQWVN